MTPAADLRVLLACGLGAGIVVGCQSDHPTAQWNPKPLIVPSDDPCLVVMTASPTLVSKRVEELESIAFDPDLGISQRQKAMDEITELKTLSREIDARRQSLLFKAEDGRAYTWADGFELNFATRKPDADIVEVEAYVAAWASSGLSLQGTLDKALSCEFEVPE